MGEFDFAGELEKLDDWKMPETKSGAHCGNGCAPLFVSINHGGGVSTRAARHMQGFGSSGVPGGEGKRAAFTVLTSIRAKRRQAHERKEADMDESDKRRTMRGGVLRAIYPRTTRVRGVLYVARGRLYGADANGGDDGRLGSSHARGRGDRALQVAAI